MQEEATNPKRRYTYRTRPQGVELVCERCGAIHRVSPRHIERGAGRFCSLACLRAHQAEMLAHPERSFLARVERTDGCWPWTGPRFSNGYGWFKVGRDGPLYLAHRYAWELATGAPPPDDMVVMHTCDNRACVRNDEPGVYVVNGVELPRYGHLALATQQVNLWDMSSKGRGAVGVRQGGLPRLTNEDGLTIQALWAGGMRQVDIAARYSISQGMVSSIVRGDTWRHLKTHGG